jgi:hypothetical protein
MLVCLVDLGLVLAMGCSTRDPAREQTAVTLTAAESRAAVDHALTIWRDRGPEAVPKPSSTGVSFVDHQRKPGQTLESYKILAESMRSRTRQYQVKLTLDRPRQTVVATYVVFGRSPLWVYRLEDFDMIMHWEHPMNGEEAAPTGEPGSDG